MKVLAPVELTEPLQSTPHQVAVKTAIRIGGVDYSLDVSKIPYLASFVKLQKDAQPETNITEFIHGPIPLFHVALKGIESGYRQCFRSLPVNLSQHRTLCETYKFLNIDVLNDMSLDAIIANLKVGKTDYNVDYGDRPIRGNKELARDTAFQLLLSRIMLSNPGFDGGVRHLNGHGRTPAMPRSLCYSA